MITIKNFQLIEEPDASENSFEYQVKFSIFNHLLETIDLLYSEKNPNLVKRDGFEPSLIKADALSLITEVIGVLNANFNISLNDTSDSDNPKSVAVNDLIKDWRGFIALASLKSTYADLLNK